MNGCSYRTPTATLQPPSKAQTEVQETLVTVNLNLEEIQKSEGPSKRRSLALEYFETELNKRKKQTQWWRRHRVKLFILGVLILLTAIILGFVFFAL
ncbi:hypothetical protein K7432_015425 [Basidiobolus ranarum]|uniref:Uncharacterized protein n=1 Tax=Basidiobolus ranarum TaxID=34480 RepID=A0ABR2VP31_9FUNG